MKRASLALVALLGTSVVFACSSSATNPITSNDAGPSPDAATAVIDARATVDAGVAEASAGNITQVPVTSAEIAKLTMAGIPTNMPLEMLVDSIKTDPKLLTLMKSFNASLGVQCSFCHTLGTDGKVDPTALPTANMKIATKMWDEWVGKLKFSDPAKTLYCDSCHQGKAEFLDRKDKEELSAWMRTNYVNALAKKDGSAHDCGTCHGSPVFKSDFLADWGMGI
jgi:hypothetical protein